MSGDDLRALIKSAGLKQYEAATLLKFHRVSVGRWVRNEVPISSLIAKHIHDTLDPLARRTAKPAKPKRSR